MLDPGRPEVGALDGELRDRGIRVVSYPDWLRLDAMEIARGASEGRPRVKFTDKADFLDALEA
jgi:ferredoxin--NADP+ reductase